MQAAKSRIMLGVHYVFEKNLYTKYSQSGMPGIFVSVFIFLFVITSITYYYLFIIMIEDTTESGFGQNLW